MVKFARHPNLCGKKNRKTRPLNLLVVEKKTKKLFVQKALVECYSSARVFALRVDNVSLPKNSVYGWIIIYPTVRTHGRPGFNTIAV